MKFKAKDQVRNSVIEVGYQKRPSAFDLKRFGIKENPTKDYRWSAPDRVDEHKYLHGYEIHKAKEGERGNESGHVETKGKMILMERDKDLARQSLTQKIIRTEQQTRRAREMRREEVERLSSKHGVDLHKFLDNYEKIEDKNGG